VKRAKPTYDDLEAEVALLRGRLTTLHHEYDRLSLYAGEQASARRSANDLNRRLWLLAIRLVRLGDPTDATGVADRRTITLEQLIQQAREALLIPRSQVGISPVDAVLADDLDVALAPPLRLDEHTLYAYAVIALDVARRERELTLDAFAAAVEHDALLVHDVLRGSRKTTFDVLNDWARRLGLTWSVDLLGRDEVRRAG